MSIRDLQPHIRVLNNALSFVRYKGLSTISDQRFVSAKVITAWVTHRLGLNPLRFFSA